MSLTSTADPSPPEWHIFAKVGLRKVTEAELRALALRLAAAANQGVVFEVRPPDEENRLVVRFTGSDP